MTTLDLASRVHRAAAWHANQVAVIDGARQRTFAEIERRTNKFANSLLALGSARGGNVAVLLPNCLECVEADLALIKAQKARVPVNVRLTPDEREYVIGDSGAETLITDADGYASISGARERLPALRNVVVVGPDAEGQLDYEDLLSQASAAAPNLPARPDAPSTILYTSGTTGRPKGAVMSSHGRWMSLLNMLVDELRVGPGDGMVHAGSMAHGSGSKTLAFFLSGARNIPLQRYDPDVFVDAMNRHNATHTFLVPTMIADLVAYLGETNERMPSFATLSYGGAPISELLLRRAYEVLGPVLVQVYGSCEAPHPVTVLGKRDHAELDGGRAASIGRESIGVSVIIADADGRPCEAGVEGEMLVRGASVMTGYWNQPDATERAFVSGAYRSGDVATRDEHGYLYILDRQRELIISGGLNVYPAEVERVISEHPDVAEVAVIGVPDERWGEAVMALVVRAAGRSLTDQAVIEHCRSRLAGYKKPRHVRFLDGLPRGSTGKVLKRELRDSFWQQQRRMVN